MDDPDQFMSTFTMFPNFQPPVNNPEKRITSIKFSADGENLVAASNQRTLEVYNSNMAMQESFLRLYKYGVTVVDFMDSNNKVLVGSMGIAKRPDYGIRALNIAQNQFDTVYTGHSQPSISLAVNVEEKFFVSGSNDRTAQVFDFRIGHAQYSRDKLSSAPLVALHPTTYMCALALDDHRIELHDLRCIGYGPFTTFNLNREQIKWDSIKFSPDAKQILISSNSSKIRVINSFTGAVEQVFGSRRNTLNIPIDASFTPNSDYILSGSSDGNVFVFNNNKMGAIGEKKVTELHSMRPEAITAVEMNPKYSIIVTASSYVAFWAPDISN